MSHDNEYTEEQKEPLTKRSPDWDIDEIDQRVVDELDHICGLLNQAGEAAYTLMERVNMHELTTYYADLSVISSISKCALDSAEACYEQARDEVEAGGDLLIDEEEDDA